MRIMFQHSRMVESSDHPKNTDLAFDMLPQPLPKPYLEGQGDLVSRIILGIPKLTMWIIGLIWLIQLYSYLLSRPDPPSTVNPEP